MERIKNQIEAQIQEIVFFGSLILSFSVFLSGIFYLTMGPATLVLILGQFGAAIDHALFATFGYAFFYLAVIALHLGYIANYHVFNFKDLKREYPVLVYSLMAHLLILSLFATSLSVFQVYLQVPSTEALAHGAGGFMGALFGGAAYSALGIYGSILLLMGFTLATGLVAEFFELPDLLIAIRTGSTTLFRVTVKGLKQLNALALNGMQFVLKGHDLHEATAMSSHHAGRIMSRANHIFTEHFHIYRGHQAEEKIEKTEKVEKKKPVLKVEKVAVAKTAEKTADKSSSKKAKMASAMSAQSEKLMNSLKELKSIKLFKKTAKPVVKASAKTEVKMAAKPAAKALAKTARPIEKIVQKNSLKKKLAGKAKSKKK